MKFKIEEELEKLQDLFIDRYHNYDEVSDSWDEGDIVNFRSHTTQMLEVVSDYFEENNIKNFEQSCADIDLSDSVNPEASVTYLYSHNGSVKALLVNEDLCCDSLTREDYNNHNLGYFLDDYVFEDFKKTILQKNVMEF